MKSKQNNSFQEIIAAISTPIGNGAIGIVRLSGEGSWDMVMGIFNPENKKEKIPPFHLSLGTIVDFNGETIDQVLVSFMKPPKSYTTEEMVEINGHGGPLVMRRILDTLLRLGARMAEGGEFTKRAFLNGRIDLTQAESVMELIKSRSAEGLRSALRGLEGRLKEEVASLRSKILSLMAKIHVEVDYPEELIESNEPSHLLKAKKIYEIMDRIVKSYETGKRIREGFKVAVMGKPNVGKSSILNRLLKSDRAIVTDVPGTTRDTIEESFILRGLEMVVVDTAGIREAKDSVERIGIELSRKAMEEVDLILMVLDTSRPFDQEDERVWKLTNGRNRLIILNKMDLEKRMSLPSELDLKNYVEISAQSDIEITKLEEAIYEKAKELLALNSKEDLVLTNQRHRNLFEKGKKYIENFINDYGKLPQNIVSINLEKGAEALSEIIGEISNENLLDTIFSDFCVGK